MRYLVLAMVAFGCGRIGFDSATGGVVGRDCDRNGSTYHSGDTFAAGDGCNSCTCSDGMIACTTDVCPDACVGCDDAMVLSACAPSGGCPSGPACGTSGLCCNGLEMCVNGVCTCGGGPLCSAPDYCSPPGVVTDMYPCGSLCCHGVSCPE
jgi:hypothetical protein